METLLKTPTSPKENLNVYGSDDEIDSNQKVLERLPKQPFSKLMQNKSYKIIMIFQMFNLMQMLAVTPFMALLGAQWFANCLINNGMEVISNCDPDYMTYNLYMTMFTSIEAVISFLTSSFMGKLSDSFGRKPFLFITILMYMVPRTMMIFYVNFWIYWILCLGQALYTGFVNIVIKSYVADIFNQKNMRTHAYAGIHSSTAIGAIFAVVLAVSITTIWNIHTVFIVLFFIYIFLILYILIFIKESLSKENRKHFELKQIKNYNPTRPLFKIYKSKFMIYMALISFLFQTVETGVLASLFSYIGDTFNLTDDSETSLIFGAVQLCMGILVIPSSIILIPFLQKIHCSETNMIIISIICRIIGLLAFSSTSYDEIEIFSKNLIILFVGCVFYGVSFFGDVVMDALLTKFVDKRYQGTAFGIITSYKDISRIFAPFSFGALYVYTRNMYNMPFIFLLLAIIICIITIFIMIFGLKPTIQNHIIINNQGMEFKTIGSEQDLQLIDLNNNQQSENRQDIENHDQFHFAGDTKLTL